MRKLSKDDQEAIIRDLVIDIPLMNYKFHFTEKHVQIISGHEEGKYTWRQSDPCEGPSFNTLMYCKHKLYNWFIDTSVCPLYPCLYVGTRG